MIPVGNVKNLLFSSRFPPDQILNTFPGSFTAVASSSFLSPHRTENAFNHSLGEQPFTELTYSLDGGTTWQDQHVSIPDLSTPSSPVFQTVTVGCYATSTQIVVVAVNYTTSSKSITYRVDAIRM